MKATVTVVVNIEHARTTLMIAGYDVSDKTDEEICEMAIKMNDCYAVDTQEITWDAPAVLDRIISDIRGYQGELNPDLNHDDLITSNAYENVIDIIETHKYLDFKSDKSYERNR